MYTSEMAIKEVNQYYALRGGRTAPIKNYAVSCSFTEQMKKAAAASRTTPAQTQEEASVSTENAKQTDTDSCCETCRQTSQLTMQLWRSLCLQSGLGSFSMGTDSLTAYQSLKNLLGTRIL